MSSLTHSKYASLIKLDNKYKLKYSNYQALRSLYKTRTNNRVAVHTLKADKSYSFNQYKSKPFPLFKSLFIPILCCGITGTYLLQSNFEIFDNTTVQPNTAIQPTITVIETPSMPTITETEPESIFNPETSTNVLEVRRPNIVKKTSPTLEPSNTITKKPNIQYTATPKLQKTIKPEIKTAKKVQAPKLINQPITLTPSLTSQKIITNKNLSTLGINDIDWNISKARKYTQTPIDNKYIQHLTQYHSSSNNLKITTPVSQFKTKVIPKAERKFPKGQKIVTQTLYTFDKANTQDIQPSPKQINTTAKTSTKQTIEPIISKPKTEVKNINSQLPSKPRVSKSSNIIEPTSPGSPINTDTNIKLNKKLPSRSKVSEVSTTFEPIISKPKTEVKNINSKQPVQIKTFPANPSIPESKQTVKPNQDTNEKLYNFKQISENIDLSPMRLTELDYVGIPVKSANGNLNFAKQKRTHM